MTKGRIDDAWRIGFCWCPARAESSLLYKTYSFQKFHEGMRTMILLIHWMPEWQPDYSRSLSNVLEWCSGKDIHWKSKGSKKVRSSEPVHQISFNEDSNVQQDCRVKESVHRAQWWPRERHSSCPSLMFRSTTLEYFNGKLLEVNDLNKSIMSIYFVRSSWLNQSNISDTSQGVKFLQKNIGRRI